MTKKINIFTALIFAYSIVVCATLTHKGQVPNTIVKNQSVKNQKSVEKQNKEMLLAIGK